MAPWSPPSYDVKIIGGRKVIDNDEMMVMMMMMPIDNLDR